MFLNYDGKSFKVAGIISQDNIMPAHRTPWWFRGIICNWFGHDKGKNYQPGTGFICRRCTDIRNADGTRGSLG